MKKDIQKVLLSEEQIKAKVQELADQLMEEYADKNPLFVGVLKGVVMFYSDIIRCFDAPCELDFMWISSYKGTNSSGGMTVRQDLTRDIKDRHVVILEDIFDTGNSLDFTYKHILAKEPASLRICTLLDKPARRTVDVKGDYIGFMVEDLFIVGYGLDFDQKYRNLPYISYLEG